MLVMLGIVAVILLITGVLFVDRAKVDLASGDGNLDKEIERVYGKPTFLADDERKLPPKQNAKTQKRAANGRFA